PDGEPAPTLECAAATVERRFPVETLGDAVEHFLDCSVFHDGSSRLRTAVAQQVLFAKLERIDTKRSRDHVSVGLIGPHQLRNAKTAQRAGRWQVRVESVGIYRDVVDVVGPASGEAGLLRHTRTDVGISTTVPPDRALARDDVAVLVEPTLDAERTWMLGDGVEDLFDRERDLDWRPRKQGKGDRERLHLDVELRAIPPAEIGHLDAHAVFWPSQ